MYNFLLFIMILVMAYAAHLIEHVSRKNFIVTGELLDSLTQVRILSGMIPICANCKKIRDDQGYWYQIESYIRERGWHRQIVADVAKQQ